MVIMGEALHLEFLGDGKEGVEVVLGHAHLPAVHEAQHRLDVPQGHTLQVEEGVGVGVPSEDAPEEGGAGREDDFMGLHLAVATGQGHIKEVLVVPQLPKGCGYVCLKVIPGEAEVLRGHFGLKRSSLLCRSSVRVESGRTGASLRRGDEHTDTADPRLVTRARVVQGGTETPSETRMLIAELTWKP